MREFVALLTVAGIGLGFVLVVLVDALEGATVFSGFLLAALLLTVGVGGLGWWFSRKQFVVLATLAIMVSLIALRFVALSPVKPFRSFHHQLEPGMSEQAVLSALASRFPVEGRFAVPSVHRSKTAEQEVVGFTLDRSVDRYDSEVVVATFEEGRLVRSEYSPD